MKIAHIRRISESEFETQSMEDHLSGTARLAEQFASTFNSSGWGRLVGLWHDMGRLLLKD